jgi:hypothetical protein
MRHSTAAALAAALLAGCGQPLLSAQIEVPEIRITTPGEEFPASAGALPQDFCDGVNPGCLFLETEYDLGEEVPGLDEEGVTVDLRLTDLALRLRDIQAPGLEGLELVTVYLLDVAGGPPIELASYAKPPGVTPTEIVVSGRSNIDLGPYLRDGLIAVRIEMDYNTLYPMGAFTADVEAGFSLVVTVDYESFM